jgi:hypothetical protein
MSDETTLLQVTIFAMSGILSGLLSKFGKIGVISGVVIADVLLMYLAKGNGVSIVYLNEIVVAAIALIVVPKNIKLDIDDLFGKNRLLNDIKCLSQNEEVIEKLETVTNTITEIIDPTDVVINSIINAISTSTMLLTTTSLIVNEHINNLNKNNVFQDL